MAPNRPNREEEKQTPEEGKTKPEANGSASTSVLNLLGVSGIASKLFTTSDTPSAEGDERKEGSGSEEEHKEEKEKQAKPKDLHLTNVNRGGLLAEDSQLKKLNKADMAAITTRRNDLMKTKRHPDVQINKNNLQRNLKERKLQQYPTRFYAKGGKMAEK